MYPVVHASIAVAATYAGTRAMRTTLPLDYRFAAFGAILPDLIDKPLKWYLIPSLPDDHLFGHTLLMPAILIVAGLVLTRYRRDTRLLLVGIGALTHVFADPVIREPRTLFWPVLGFEFPDARGIVPLSWIGDIVVVTIGAVVLRKSERARRAARDFALEGRLPWGTGARAVTSSDPSTEPLAAPQA